MKMLTVFLLLIVGLSALPDPTHAQFSASAKMLLLQVEEAQSQAEKTGKVFVLPDATLKHFAIRKIEGEYRVHGMLLVEPDGARAADLEALGVRVHRLTPKIWSVVIPLRVLPALEHVSGVRKIDVNVRPQKKLDKARMDVGADVVHAGGGTLPQGYTGAGVVIGVIDTGFDYTHPTFRDLNNSVVRITRVWEQGFEQGPAPASFGYGTEFTTAEAIVATQADDFTAAHGSHVAGIAGGSGLGSDGRYMGIAPNAELVMVSMGDQASAIPDAVKYIFDYATSVGKPAVINMSLGSHIGPHDGTSLSDQAFDGLAGPGRILVGAAGNEGATPLHLGHTFASATPDTIYTGITFESSEGPGLQGTGTIDIWGAPNTDFEVTVFQVDAAGTLIGNTGFVKASTNTTAQGVVATVGTHSSEVQFATVARDASNNRPNIQVALINPLPDTRLILAVTSAQDGAVHVWNHGQGTGTSLVNLSDPTLKAGDIAYTVGELGGTGRSVLTVGAYTTNPIKMADGATSGDLADFSSRGPTLDNRIKPEITAPGHVVVSAVNSFWDDGPEEYPEVLRIDGTNYIYGAQQGTSMATPVVTGIIALMLEANHTLTPTDIREAFAATGRQDNFTGTLPFEGDNTWGFGKVDALAAVERAARVATALDDSEPLPRTVTLSQNYPNPFNPSTSIHFTLPDPGAVRLAIYDVLGREVAVLVDGRVAAGRHQVTYDAANLTSGTYFYRLETPQGRQARVMVLMK